MSMALSSPASGTAAVPPFLMVLLFQLVHTSTTSALTVATEGISVQPSGNMNADFSLHGGDWRQGSCGSRARQSPVNFNELGLPPDDEFLYEYTANGVNAGATASLSNDGRVISLDLAGKGVGSVKLPHAAHAWYDLVRIDVHGMSEHTLRGEHAALEIQLVHKVRLPEHSNARHEQVTISVLVDSPTPVQTKLHASNNAPDARPSPSGGYSEDGTFIAATANEIAFNAALQAFSNQEPPVIDERIDVPTPAGIGSLLAGGTYFVYRGSETLPPCTESVLWLVRRERVLASDRQVRALIQRLYATTNGLGNYRTVMPMNHRGFKVWRAQPHPPPSAASPVVMPAPMSNRSAVVAERALRVAGQALDAAHAMASRLAAAEAASHAPQAPASAQLPAHTMDPSVLAAAEAELHRRMRQDVAAALPAAQDLVRGYMQAELMRQATLPVHA
eukprot:TRINITY_DN63298_c0_g1_i1.p1 TRINITY_DN63298_c0_g1~~TRINITY_DN63298_c0_g1_i1.p1  ORF type:complete len:447 (+),score=71.64 TRINITY_DN63298_c0_g1_i1:139-1479(+)